jgi:alanine racemase
MNAYIVSRQDLLGNVHKLKEIAGDKPVYGVIKGNGYGLGLIPMAEALREGGIDRFAVTELSEVRALREHGFETEEILMLRATCLHEELSELLALGATATVGSLACAEAMEQAAKEAGTVFPCHIKIDTGMGRYGFFPEETQEISQVYALPHLQPTGIYTHFHSAFCNEQETRQQFSAFQKVCDTLTDQGLKIGLRHCCNSSAFLQYPEMHMDAVRVGSALLGRLAVPNDLTRIGWCESKVEVLRELPKGHSVGYGAAWKAKRPTKIAVCGVGYFHGFGAESGNDIFRFRDCVRGGLSYVKAFLKKKAFYVTVNGKPARVLGHIGMVQTICDVTDIPCQVGDPIRIEINPLLLKGMEIRFQ